MKDFIIPYYQKAKEILLKATSENADLEELERSIKNVVDDLSAELYRLLSPNNYEFEGNDAVYGLSTKFKRLLEDYKYIERDYESQLAKKLEWGFDKDYEPCPYSKDEFPGIQKKIAAYIRQRVTTSEDEDTQPLLTGKVKKPLTPAHIDFIINTVMSRSQELTDYVTKYANDDIEWSWNWKSDCIRLIQYVFEKGAELTYFVANKKSTENLSFDIREAFTYFQLSVPEKLQWIIDEVVDILDQVANDTIFYIEKNKFNQCGKDTWFLPIMSGIALYGMYYTLENYTN